MSRFAGSMGPCGVASPAPTGATDPNFSSVVLLADFEGTPSLSYIEQSPLHKTVTFTATADSASQSNMSSTQAEYGIQSERSDNTTNASAPDSNDWDLSDANSSQFTIEYSYFQTERVNNYPVINRLINSGQFAFMVRHTGTSFDWFWSTDGSSVLSLSAATAITVGNMNTWAKYAVCKNSSGKLRLFVNGGMVASSTPADSTIFHSTANMQFGGSAAAQTSYLDNIRITKGVCRYDSDSSYTTATAAFPTS